jgi:hypothetical protein
MAARRSWHARTTLFATAAAMLVTALLPSVAAQAAAALPAPTQLRAWVTSDIAAPCSPSGTCGNPGVLTVQNTAFTLHVSLTDDTGAAAAFNKDTNLALSATPGAQFLSPTSVGMGKGLSEQSFPVTYSTYANNVVIQVSYSARKGGFSGNTAAFNVLQTLETFGGQAGVGFQHGIGPDDCATVSSTNPVCGILVLPNGSNTDVLLSSGSCVGVGCNTKGTVTQFIGDITGLYSKTNPATLILKCNRTVCGRGGVSQLVGVAADSQMTGALLTAAPCPAKNTIGADQRFCTDQVQNVRLNADDSLIYILFADDFRASI